MTRFLAGLGVHGTAGLSFSPTLGASVWFGVRHAWLGLRLLGRADLPTSLDVTGGSVVINVLAASLVPCVHILDALGVCAVGTVGGLQVKTNATGVYDPLRQRVLAIGGQFVTITPYQVVARSDTWEWDGTTWSLRPVVLPLIGERDGTAAAFDAASGLTVLFGGRAHGYHSDTWLLR